MGFQDIEFLAGLDIDAILMVIFVDLVLSGDNAIIIGMAAASLPPTLRRKAIIWGIGLAVVLRIVLAALTFYLLQLHGIKFIGALLLLGVCYFMWKDLKISSADQTNTGTPEEDAQEDQMNGSESVSLMSPEFSRAMLKIIVADVTMSLDNVLAVAGIAHDNIGVLIFGLVLSIVLMAIGANLVSRLLQKYHWLGYIGLLIIFYVALEMGYYGGIEVLELLSIRL